ncbi:hypothetical protein P3T36_006904 [Kitasatospora sp. MAP12-15]|uniref:hypothetical protein n=1 Tax=unclassified Kitasatospora TaxID=2633591 RepID=UPI002475B935|nr:hypothetical protein [Kitasatospora sp. MAP12-44]MDH6111913.1 hypothetical protein [Kitasatospora sp. MAP12-44]
MPYATSTRTQPVPRPPRRRNPWIRHAQAAPAGTGQSLAQQLNGAASTPRVYISFDPPYTPNPAWLDVTSYVDQDQPITINPGRPDGLADPGAATCTLTVDNTDGRWTAGNPSSAWCGLIRKGAWLRVDLLPLSGTASRRFTGYITALPTTITGAGAQSQISASDVFVLLTQAPKYATMLVEEWMSDTVGAPYIAGYWPLGEPAGATYASDVSGQAPAGGQSLTVRSIGVAGGTGLTWSSAPAPGFDGRQTAMFAPSGNPYPGFSGNTNALPNGSYLQGTIRLQAVAQFTCWIKTTTPYQPIWSWADPTTNYVIGLGLDSNGCAQLYQAPLTSTNSAIGNLIQSASKLPLTDGAWHQISVRLQTVAATGGGASYLSAAIDGAQTYFAFGSATPSAGFCPSPALSRITVGGAEGWNAITFTSGVSLFTGAISDVVAHLIPAAAINPSWYSAYLAGATGHAGENTGQRVARLVSYAGLPVPEQPTYLPGTYLTVPQPTTGTSPVLHISPTAHPCGPQAITGKNVLDALRTVAHTEGMPLFVDAYGRITLQASTQRANPVPALTIAAVDLDPTTAFADDFQYLVNQVQVTPSGAGAITVTTGGAASRALFGEYATQLDTVNLNGLEAASLGAALIAAGANPPPRPAPLAVEAATLAQLPGYGPAWYDAVLALTLSGVLQVTGWQEQSPYGAGGTSSHTVEGWTETITAGQHLIAWSTSPAQGPTYQCDSPTLGLCDTPGITLAY